jgi:glycosyltransferase involved in cell wall biosynthesis
MISSRPLVSVVIPTRNRPTHVLRAVRSALQQTLREIEVIVVIDGEPGRGPGPLHRVAGNGRRRRSAEHWHKGCSFSMDSLAR